MPLISIDQPYSNGDSGHRRRNSSQPNNNLLPDSAQGSPEQTPLVKRASPYLFSKQSLSDEDLPLGQHSSLRWRTTKSRSWYSRAWNVCGLFGWIIALVLLVLILWTAPPVKFQDAVTQFQRLRGIQPAEAVQLQGVTLVSAFFLINNGKKHAVQGQFCVSLP